MSHLLDTNACIALINDSPPAVRRRFRKASARGELIGVPSVVIFELWYGVAKSTRKERNTARLRTFLSGPIAVVPFDDDDAQRAGAVRAALEAKGAPIGAYDVLIAGQALRRGATLVTANGAEFGRVPELAWVDWSVTSASSRE